MLNFKAGDRVVIDVDAKINKVPMNLEERDNKVGVVVSVSDRMGMIDVQWEDTKGTVGYFKERFKLAEVSLTDEELAARYREGRKASLADFDELSRRGYTIAHNGGPFQNFLGHSVEIYKTVEEEVVVTQTKKVRKEI